MSASSPEGILGSIVLVAIFWVAYLIATRKSTRNLSTSTAIPPTLPGGSNGKWYEQYGGYMWSVLLVIVGGGAVLWGMYHPVRLADAVQWREYWFPLLALWGFAAALVALNAKALGAAAAKTLQWVLAGTVFALFIGLPLVNLFWGEKTSSPHVQACLPFSNTEVRRCVLTEKPIIMTTERLTYAEVHEFCVVKSEGGAYRSEKIGPNTFQVRSERGALHIEYKLLRGVCPSKF